MKRIVHIITDLDSGGAENMLLKFLRYSDKEEYFHEVISLKDEGVIGEKIIKEGIKVHCLNLHKSNFISSFNRAVKICKNFDIINTWLYHADIFGFILSKVMLRKKLIWNIRHSNLDKEANKKSTLRIVKTNSLISKYVDCITYNSNKALETHQEIGYKNNHSVIIPNGFELDRYKFNIKKRVAIRKKLMIKDNEKVIITVGRWDIQKDYYTLMKALNELKVNKTDYKVIMVGTKLDEYNEELVSLIKKYNLEENIILLGRRDDIVELLSAADLYVSSSMGESFSNAIGEAMACELTCIVTNVGDSKLMVANSGIVVEKQDYLKMAAQIGNFIKQPKSERNKVARKRVLENYEIRTVVKNIEGNIFRF
ncbi:glycosyltransferase [Rossellomorea vietnamensis]|uniref:glycosyltransferase n=1 Tax=Rossellomorea vietnamensis TaxID=218284 RepID=UPI003CE7A6BE